MKEKKHRVSLLLAILSALVVGLVQYFDWCYPIDQKAMDALYQEESSALNTIKIIKIDEKTLEALGPFGTWDRGVYAKLVSLLDNAYAPDILAFDITFAGHMSAQGDLAFAQACEKFKNVVIANNLVVEPKVMIHEENKQPYLDRVHVTQVEQPYESLYEATYQGFADAIFDKDGVIRHALLSKNYEGKEYISFSEQIYQLYCKQKKMPIQEVALDEKGRFGFAYSRKSDGYETMSLIDVLDGTIDPRIFKDSIVLVGAYAQGMQDAFQNPIDSQKLMYGVEIHANLLQARMQAKTYVDASALLCSLGSSVIVFGFVLWLQKNSVLVCGGVLTILCLLLIVISKLLFHQGIQVPLLVLPSAMCLCYIASILNRYLQEVKKRIMLMRIFKRYVAPQVVDEVMKKEDVFLKLGGETRDIAVLFVDIRGFTPLSEQLQAHEVVDVLNTYLNLTSSAIFAHKGTLDKYIGDATMAVFNSPFDLEDYVYQAVCTALDIVKGQEEVGRLCHERYNITIGFGIGIHCGSAVVGNIGSEFRMDFTAIGDTVNVAARLEGIAQAGQILISEEVYRRLKKRIQVKEIGQVALKGKKEKQLLYEVIGLIEEGEHEAA